MNLTLVMATKHLGVTKPIAQDHPEVAKPRKDPV